MSVDEKTHQPLNSSKKGPFLTTVVKIFVEDLGRLFEDLWMLVEDFGISVDDFGRIAGDLGMFV